jgi:hypothetical protein
MAEAELKPCFVAAPIGSSGSDTRRRSDRLLEFVIRPAAVTCGYRAFRADEEASSGIITDHVIANLLNSPMVVADLTERNSNVFYELAVRHMIKKPVVHVIRAGDAVPFDIMSLRVLQLDDPDLENVTKSQQLLCEFIKSAEGEPGRNPISSAADLEALRTSGDPLRAEVARLKDEMSQLRALIQTQRVASAGGMGVTAPSSSLLELHVAAALENLYANTASEEYRQHLAKALQIVRKRDEAARAKPTSDILDMGHSGT